MSLSSMTFITPIESPDLCKDLRSRTTQYIDKPDSHRDKLSASIVEQTSNATLLQDTEDFSSEVEQLKMMSGYDKNNNSEQLSIFTKENYGFDTNSIQYFKFDEETNLDKNYSLDSNSFQNYKSDEETILDFVIDDDDDGDETEPTMEKARDKHDYRQFRDRKNDPSTDINHEYYSEKLLASDENICEDFSNNLFFDNKRVVIVDENDPEFEAHIIEAEHDLKESCFKENYFRSRQSSRRMSVKSVTSGYSKPDSGNSLSRHSKRINGSLLSVHSEIFLNTCQNPRMNQALTQPFSNTSVTNFTVKFPKERNKTSHEASFIGDDKGKQREKGMKNAQTSNGNNRFVPNDWDNNSFFEIHGHCDTLDNCVLDSKEVKLVPNGFGTGEKNSNSKYSNVENGVAHNKSRTNINIVSLKRAFQKHENANTTAAPFSLKQATGIDKLANYEASCESAVIESVSSFTDVQRPGVELHGLGGAHEATKHHSNSDSDEVSGKKYNTTKQANDKKVKMSKTVLHKLPKIASFNKNPRNIHHYTATMKAIDRLRAGPYSKNLSLIFSAPRSGKHKNLMKTKRTKKIKQTSKDKSHNHDVKEDLVSTDGSTDTLRQIKITKSQAISLYSEDHSPITKSHINRTITKRIASGKDNSAFRGRHRKLAIPGETFFDQDKPSLCAEKENHVEGIIAFADTHNLRIQPATPDCQTSLDNVIIMDNAGNPCEENAAVFEKVQLKSRMVPKEILSPDIHGPDIAALENQKKLGGIEWQYINTADQKHEETEDKGKKKDRIKADKISVTLNKLLKSKQRLKVSSPGLTKIDNEEEHEVDHITRVDEPVDVNKILITRVHNSPVVVRSAVNKHHKPPASTGSSTIPSADLSVLDETLVSERQVQSMIAQVFLNDLRHTFTARISPSSTNPSRLSRNCSTEVPTSYANFGDSGKKKYDGLPHKSISMHDWTISGGLKNSFFGVASMAENTVSLNSPRQSLDSVSRKSVDYRILNTTKVVLPSIDDEPKSVLTKDESFIRSAIPLLPLPVAVLCLISNIVVPGLGTALSGLLVLCCGQPRMSRKDDQILSTICVNCMVGLAQLFTVTFLFVGWFWSIAWGVRMVLLSVQHQKRMNEQRAMELQTFAANALESTKKPKKLEI